MLALVFIGCLLVSAVFFSLFSAAIGNVPWDRAQQVEVSDLIISNTTMENFTKHSWFINSNQRIGLANSARTR